MNILSDYFRQQLTDGAMEGYWIALSDLTDAQMNAAVTRALRESKFLPSGSELITFAGVANALPLRIAEAWEAVRRAIRVHDYTDSVDFGPRVNAVVRNMGGWLRLCELNREQLDVWGRKEFERAYEAFADKPEGQLNGEPHRGELLGPIHWVQIGNANARRDPKRQLPSPSDDSAMRLVAELAERKS